MASELADGDVENADTGRMSSLRRQAHAAAAERTTTQQSERRDREGYHYPFECRDHDVLQLIKIRMWRDAQGSRRQ